MCNARATRGSHRATLGRRVARGVKSMLLKFACCKSMKPLPPLVVRAVPIHFFTRLSGMARVSMSSLACCRSPGLTSMNYWWLSPCHSRMCYLVFCCRSILQAWLLGSSRFETFSHYIRDDATKTQNASSKERISIYWPKQIVI